MKIIFTLSKSYIFILFVGCVFCLLPQNSKAQQTQVSLRIINAKKEPVPFASVSVIAVKDTTHAIHKVSDSTGIVMFNLVYGQYLVSVSSINYAPFQKGITIKTDNPVFTFTADVVSKTLQSVDIVSSRPMIRQEDDKTIVDPENLAASSTNAYEILEKTPGLFVDQDGNIYLSSTTPATVYINGREQKMSSADIATCLLYTSPSPRDS